MYHCLCTYRTVGDNVYGLGNWFLMVSSLNYVPFSLVLFLSVCVPVERVSHLQNKPSFSGIKDSTQLSVLILALEKLSLICSYLAKVSSKSWKNVSCVMIAVFAVRCVQPSR